MKGRDVTVRIPSTTVSTSVFRLSRPEVGEEHWSGYITGRFVTGGHRHVSDSEGLRGGRGVVTTPPLSPKILVL